MLLIREHTTILLHVQEHALQRIVYRTTKSQRIVLLVGHLQYGLVVKRQRAMQEFRQCRIAHNELLQNSFYPFRIRHLYAHLRHRFQR